MAMEAALTVGITALATVVTVLWRKLSRFYHDHENRLRVTESELKICQKDRLALWQELAKKG